MKLLISQFKLKHRENSAHTLHAYLPRIVTHVLAWVMQQTCLSLVPNCHLHSEDENFVHSQLSRVHAITYAEWLLH